MPRSELGAFLNIKNKNWLYNTWTRDVIAYTKFFPFANTVCSSKSWWRIGTRSSSILRSSSTSQWTGTPSSPLGPISVHYRKLSWVRLRTLRGQNYFYAMFQVSIPPSIENFFVFSFPIWIPTPYPSLPYFNSPQPSSVITSKKAVATKGT